MAVPAGPRATPRRAPGALIGPAATAAWVLVLALALAAPAVASPGAGPDPSLGGRLVVPVPAAVAAPAPARPTAATGYGPYASLGDPSEPVELRPAAIDPPASPEPGDDPAEPAYAGQNHVWIPSLGIDRRIYAFPCSRTRPPDDLAYRWGCAGTNNIYLLGHAYGVFEPLHDAYYDGRLREGMEAVYADDLGRIHVFEVTWWRKTLPTTDAAWAWADQDLPSMTLQTCLGARSEYRLIVRLVEVS
jgi:hypothetical protein